MSPTKEGTYYCVVNDAYHPPYSIRVNVNVKVPGPDYYTWAYTPMYSANLYFPRGHPYANENMYRGTIQPYWKDQEDRESNSGDEVFAFQYPENKQVNVKFTMSYSLPSFGHYQKPSTLCAEGFSPERKTQNNGCLYGEYYENDVEYTDPEKCCSVSWDISTRRRRRSSDWSARRRCCSDYQCAQTKYRPIVYQCGPSTSYGPSRARFQFYVTPGGEVRTNSVANVNPDITIYDDACEHGKYRHGMKSKWDLMTNLKAWCNETNRQDAEIVLGPVSTWDVSGVTDMQQLFSNAPSQGYGFSECNPDISGWDTSKVTNMKWMFYGATQTHALGHWKTGNVRTMYGMFMKAPLFNQPLNDWDTSKVTDMRSMFQEAYAFNQSLAYWDTSQVTDMRSMFRLALAFNQSVGTWDTGKVRYMRDMFSGAISFDQPVNNWDMSKVVENTDMWKVASSMRECNKPGADPCAVTPTPSPTPPPPILTKTDLQSKVNEWCNDRGTAEAAFGPISTWDVSQVTNMASLFEGKTSCNPPIGNWDTSQVTTMERMFMNARRFNQPIGKWDTSKVNTMYQMFYKATAFNQAIGDWDTSQVTNMDYMLCPVQLSYRKYTTNTGNFNQPIGKWDTSKVTRMSAMFWNAAAFNQPIGNWDTSQVTENRWMFLGATAFDQPINNFNAVPNTDLMFQEYEHWLPPAAMKECNKPGSTPC